MPINAANILSGRNLEEYQGLTPAEQAEFQAEFDDTALELIKPVALVLGAAEKILDIVHDSEVIPRVAKLHRKYYLELLGQGFSADQALALSSSFASLLQGVKKP